MIHVDGIKLIIHFIKKLNLVVTKCVHQDSMMTQVRVNSKSIKKYGKFFIVQ